MLMIIIMILLLLLSLSLYSQDYRTTCGIMFEVVTGIPKSEGMEPPPKIPANPSFVELEEDENAVDKFKTGMAAIANVLALDRLKQVGVVLVGVAYSCVKILGSIAKREIG